MPITAYAFFGALEMGFVYGLMALGVYLTFRVLEFPDLTVDGSLPLGAAVTSVLLTSGFGPIPALFFAAMAGFAAGCVTGVLNTKLGILNLLASILTMIGLYSINIRVMGRPNMALLGEETVLTWVRGLPIPPMYTGTILFGIITLVVCVVIIWFLHSQFGQAMLATGDNPQMITSQGVNTNVMIIFGVGLSNALVAFSGGLVAQNQGAADVNMGVGTIVAGLASVIVGETIFGKQSVTRAVIAVVLGSIVYRLVIAVALSLKIGDFSFDPSDLKIITSVLVVAALTMPQLRRHMAAAKPIELREDGSVNTGPRTADKTANGKEGA